MDAALYWFGVAHVVVYAICGSLALFMILFNWWIGWIGVTRDLVRMYGRYLSEKRAKEEGL